MAEEVKVRVLTTPKAKTSNVKPTVSSNKPVNSKVRKESRHSDTRRRAILLIAKILFFVALCYIVFFVIFGVARMSDYSMYPNVREGDLLLYYRLENDYNNGDVVVVDRGNGLEVFRIIASSGQSVDISAENTMLVDNQPPVYEGFYETPRAESIIFSYPYEISDDCYFMLNDYRSNTNDSRIFGEVCKKNIKGRLITKVQIRDL